MNGEELPIDKNYKELKEKQWLVSYSN